MPHRFSPGRRRSSASASSDGSSLEEIVGFARPSGLVCISRSAEAVGVGDVRVQAGRCFEIIGDALRRAGSGWQDVVRTRLILTNIEDWKAAVDVRARHRREAKPADTIMQITRFVNPEWLVEVEADAVVADSAEAPEGSARLSAVAVAKLPA